MTLGDGLFAYLWTTLGRRPGLSPSLPDLVVTSLQDTPLFRAFRKTFEGRKDARLYHSTYTERPMLEHGHAP